MYVFAWHSKYWHDPVGSNTRHINLLSMESKEELYHHGLNPHYFETFNDEMCMRVLFALESLRIPYTRIPYHHHDVRSLRFYVQDGKSLEKLRKFLEQAHPTISNGDDYAKYELVYENSFV